MRADGARKKKLIVAFHWLRDERQRGEQAGWKCGQCRRQGLEVRRRCGFLTEEMRGPRRVVWARGTASSEECPTSAVEPASVEFVERFFVWKMGGAREISAREADAFVIIERELRAEANG
jgi:hypothetical protein